MIRDAVFSFAGILEKGSAAFLRSMTDTGMEGKDVSDFACGRRSAYPRSSER